MLFYPAALPLSRQTLTYVTGIIRRHRAQIGTLAQAAPERRALLGFQPMAWQSCCRSGVLLSQADLRDQGQDSAADAGVRGRCGTGN